MDSERVISLAEAEIKRKEAKAKLGCWFSNDYMEVACAIRELLESYVRLNTFEREAQMQTGMPLAKLLDVQLEEPMLHAKNVR